MVLDHIGRPQILMIDRVVISDERQRRLVLKVLSLATHRLMSFGEERDRLMPAAAP
jgi:hypothetical protein